MFLKVYQPYCELPNTASIAQANSVQVPPPDDDTATVVRENCDVQTRELQQQVQLSSLLNQINNAIRSTLDLDEVLQTACRLLAKTLNCDRASILVTLPEDRDTLITRGEYKKDDYPSQLGLKVPLQDNAHLQMLISQAKPLAVTRFVDFPGLGRQTQEIVEKLGIRSMLAIAMRYQGRVNGILGLHQCDREREWTAWEQDLLEGVASQLAIAINQAQLYSATRAAAEREALLRLVTDQIRSTLDLQTILQTAVRGVRELLQTDRVVIYQFKENWHGEIVVEDLLVPWPSIFGDMVADNCFSGEYAKLYQKGRVRAINDIHNAGLESCHERYLASLQVKANLIVPIAIGEKLWGLLIAHECHAPRRWTNEEIDLLRQLGDRLAIAISQGELYAQVQEAAATSKAQAEQLQATLEELKATQQQLIQSEKLSGLGQMVAGIAHEINNANNFIHANLPHAIEYAEALNEAIDFYAESHPQAASLLEQIRDEFDLDYIREDFPKLLNSMQQGSNRIRTIVQTLRNFSHLDEAPSKAVDLNQGLDNSLAMLQHRLQPGLKVSKHYGKLPPVECRPGQINQVFFNLINNALDALENQGEGAELTLTTYQSGPDWVTISIRDNGPGIAPEIQGKIFDPFFTTKPVGKGTGLGLSLCYQAIAQDGGGKIRCVSEAGQGAEFLVELPVKPTVR
ncbi:GAF domain-containing sensor histidine kinase [Phormidium sp. CCY1219]|uniref:GAF domain-containing sensor histidine kinase n=1 Tax=Phormidium sp. CCY1219 TaxID=2886104 RepID=UPI002D1EDFFB|nr:GAF domain-containing protein [Phormidium sp. CCY1219]MEB3830283.1 GAF domain-containing protein [Phormidium sp. CCY1219]